MKKWIGYTVVAGVLPWLIGCDVLTDILLPSTVTVSLVNDSPDFDVEAMLIYHDDEDVLEVVLPEVGTEREFTIEPGGTATFIRDCDVLQAVVIDDADLLIIGGVGPETSSDILRMGEDFECGDEIIFTFTHGDLLLDFDVTAETHPRTWE